MRLGRLLELAAAPHSLALRHPVLTPPALVPVAGEDLYDLFGKYGAIRQIRIGNGPKTRGTAFVVYEEVADVSIPRPG